MKKLICFLALTLSVNILHANKNPLVTLSDNNSSVVGVWLDANNVRAAIRNSGIINRSWVTGDAGFEWPKSSGKFAIFTSGISISGFINGNLSQIMSSYTGEFTPGIIIDNAGHNSPDLKIYSIKAGDNSSSNPDYANWGLIVPYGAPFDDVNGNGQYDPGIDKPGVKNSAQTIFVPLTGGFVETRTVDEGFGGGVTNPLMLADVRLTAWCYNSVNHPFVNDVQFLKWEVINQSTSQTWENLRIAIVSDPDIGDYNDDYIGCDTLLRLGYCYNGRPVDGTGTGNSYGALPPAVGKVLLRGPANKLTNEDYSFTSFIGFTNTSTGGPPCESDPRTPPEANNMMKGLKKDGSPFLNPYTLEPTLFVYPGDPEQNHGPQNWTEFGGSVQNCGGINGNIIGLNPVGDRRFVIGNGGEDFMMQPGDTQTIIAAQLIRRGLNYRNSVTRLKEYADSVITFYNNGFVISVSNINSEVPERYKLHQNYPNPFNPVTKIVFEIPSRDFIRLELFDVTGRKVSELISSELSAGVYSYELNAGSLTTGVYFYRLTSGNFSATKKLMVLK